MNIKIFDKIIEQNPRVILLGREMSFQMFPLLILVRLLLLSSVSWLLLFKQTASSHFSSHSKELNKEAYIINIVVSIGVVFNDLVHCALKF